MLPLLLVLFGSSQNKCGLTLWYHIASFRFGRLSKDSIVHAIFQSLFGKRRVRSGPRERYGGDWDDVDDEDDEGEKEEDEEVDESWIKTGISLSLFSSKAVDFACR